MDGAAILSLVHSSANSTGAMSFDVRSRLVAQTVKAYNEAFCAAYPVNSADSAGGGGVLSRRKQTSNL